MIAKWRDVEVDPEDCFLTNGALAGLVTSLQILTDPGDEVLIASPLYFNYPSMCEYVGAKLVQFPVKSDMDLDINAIADAITDRTRVIIVNSPNNPTGRIYPVETLKALADLLREKSSQRVDRRPIVLVSDEAYCRIVFDGASCPSPITFYDHSLLVYTFGKTTLSPGQRLGYIALSPQMPVAHREELRDSFQKNLMTTYSMADSLTAKALVD